MLVLATFFLNSFSSLLLGVFSFPAFFYLHVPAKEMDLDKEGICNTTAYGKICFM